MDKRSSRRSGEQPAGAVFIEIEHSYGPRRTSVYRVLEEDERGLSFLVPGEDGYFLEGTPLRFSIILKDRLRTKHFGFTRSCQPTNSEEGEKIYRIGVELCDALRTPPRTEYILRTPRLRSEKGKEFHITFRLAEEEFHFELTDFSRYSAAFACTPDDLLSLRISMVLSDVRIEVGKRAIFAGTAAIRRIARDAKGKPRVVIEPRGLPIDLGAVRQADLLNAAFEGTSSLIAQHDKYQSVDATFRAMVADLRFFLEDFRHYLENPLLDSESQEPARVLQEIFPLFFNGLDGKVTRLDSYAAGLIHTQEGAWLHRQYYQKNLLSLFVAAPYNHRIYFKPKGYPGDFEMMRLVHRDSFEGASLFGKILNKYSTSIPIARAVRERTAYFKERLAAELARNPALQVLSVASGPALEFDALLAETPALADGLSATLLDQEIEALQFSLENLSERRIRAGCGMRISCLHQNIGNYLRRVARRQVGERYDLIYAAGLFDYFDRKTSTFVIRQILSLLRPGGHLVVANLSLTGHRHRVYMEYGHDWSLIYRSSEEMAELAEGLPEGTRIEVGQIADGLVTLLEVSPGH
ncbi:MAG: O-methyltransferase [Candidatus Methylomirabilia bacterium]